MTFTQLRLIHPRLIYKQFEIRENKDAIDIRHEFILEPDISFSSNVSIPHHGHVDKERLAPFAFHLGLVEAISYWKAACPSEFVIEAGYLSVEQVRFWYDLFIHGLGEFFYRNQIDFTQKDFLTIRSTATSKVRHASFNIQAKGDLMLIGGGKDSAVTSGMLKRSDRTIQTMIVNPTKAALDTIQISGFSAPIIVTRTMDPALVRLNKDGYLNGHTPFSAYLAFLGITVAALHDFEHVIVSNERSANEGNVMYRGLEVNHQYSKSFRFEAAFREYVNASFTESATYFSMLRPLNDVQIARLFAGFPQYFDSFRSCNVGSKQGVWCGACPKCAFTYLILSPFLTSVDMNRIFGRDYFLDDVILGYIAQLVGLKPIKPFECVGTRDETKLALLLYIQKCLDESREIPEGLLKIKSDLNVSSADITFLREHVLDEWGDTFNLPDEYLSVLRQSWETLLDAPKYG